MKTTPVLAMVGLLGVSLAFTNVARADEPLQPLPPPSQSAALQPLPPPQQAQAPASTTASSPYSSQSAGEDRPRGKTGWALPGAIVGLGLSGAGLVMAIASDGRQSDGKDGIPLGAASLTTFIVAATIVGISRASTDGKGSVGMRIGAYCAFGVAAIAGGAMLGNSMRTGEAYPSGVITGIGALATAGMSLFATESLIARADALKPAMTIVPNAQGGIDGTIGVSKRF